MAAKKERIARTAGAVWMVVFLLWLPVEDTRIWASLTLAVGALIWLFLQQRFDLRESGWLGAMGWGALSGFGTLLLAITLMAFKSGLHGHGFADFSVRQLINVVSLIPIGVLAGIILAATVKLLFSRRSEAPTSSS